MLYRYWRTWRAKTSLFDTRNRRPSSCFYAKKVCFPECDPSNATHRHFEPYEGLAEIWHAYASSIQRNYPAFVTRLAKIKRLELQSILDLACGTGTMTAQLAGIAQQVVGLDSSGPMLRKAQSRSCELQGVRFIQGDFRKFELGQRFDVVVCACNSLNYVSDIADLRSVFRSVAEHLRPDGLFVFDTITEAGMQLMSGFYLHIQVDDIRFAMHFEYDAKSRKERGEILLPLGSESHVQVPIDPADVAAACRNSGLVLEDHFSSAFWPGWWHTSTGSFFVLRRERT